MNTCCNDQPFRNATCYYATSHLPQPISTSQVIECWFEVLHVIEHLFTPAAQQCERIEVVVLDVIVRELVVVGVVGVCRCAGMTEPSSA